jgi:hypothetical protein
MGLPAAATTAVSIKERTAVLSVFIFNLLVGNAVYVSVLATTLTRAVA